MGRMSWAWVAAVLALGVLAGCGQSPAPSAPAGVRPAGSGQVTVGTYTHPWGTRGYRLYRPAAGQLPLLVMLHGCTQTAADFALGTRMDRVADALGFAVLYPEQSLLANASRCWNWFYSLNQGRSGEAALLADMARDLARSFGLDGSRIGVAGLSAGGAMAVILAAAYPERFAFLGVVAGLEYKAAETPYGAFLAMQQGGPDPQAQGAKVCQAWGRAYRIPLAVFHGDADTTVNPVNGQQVYLHWLYAHRYCGTISGWTESRSTVSMGGRNVSLRTARDGQWTLAEFYLIQGMNHRWPGGDPSGSYTDPSGPDASGIIASRWLASR